jgi:cell division protein FtsI (penicillin-binding protein 3)
VIGLDEAENREHARPLRTAGWTAVPVAGDAIRRIAPVLGLRPHEPRDRDLPLLYTLAGND